MTCRWVRYRKISKIKEADFVGYFSPPNKIDLRNMFPSGELNYRLGMNDNLGLESINTDVFTLPREPCEVHQFITPITCVFDRSWLIIRDMTQIEPHIQ